MTVVILEDAAADIESGWKFYEAREAGVGAYFVESILSDLGSLVLFAGIHPVRFGFHRMLSKRFPFGIYYEVEGETAFVYAVLDMRRDPLWTRSELRKRS
jgi:hypothetical protein